MREMGAKWKRLGLMTLAASAGLACLVAFLALAGQTLLGGGYAKSPPTLPDAHGAATAGTEMSVKTIRPKRDPGFEVAVQLLATVEPFYQAELRSRVAGVVKLVRKDIGDRVSRDELLLEIDVPDLREEVLQKEAVVRQREQEWRLAKAHVKNGDAAVEVARANERQRETEVTEARATAEFRRKRLARFEQLAERKAINDDVVDEARYETAAAGAAVEAALTAVQKAAADLKDKEASREADKVDVELKEALIEVARKDRDRVAAQAAYARITAPFDGVITRRNADPGMFVQNSTTANTTPLIVIARADVVTVSARAPDNVAPFVHRGTPVDIRIDELPGVTLDGFVTRYSPSIETVDRTMRVEVDLFNGTDEDYRKSRAESVGAVVGPLGAGGPLAAALLTESALFVRGLAAKGFGDAPACCPVGLTLTGQRLLPQMTGYMKVRLQRFEDACLLPSSAVFSQGGKPYILVVEAGKSRQVPVRVQANDGRLALVAIHAPGGDGKDVVFRRLTGTEEVIVSRQLEVGDGQVVRPTLEDW